MNRPGFAMLLVLLIAAPVAAKFICPPGRFQLEVDRSLRMAVPDGVELELGDGTVTLAGVCPSVRGRQFHRGLSAWLYRVRAVWPRCGGHGRLALRGRFDGSALYCTRLVGTLRHRGGQRAPFVAERIPVCGNGIRERGEQCDDGGFDVACCQPDCRVAQGCEAECDAQFFGCEAGTLCRRACDSTGVCRAPNPFMCGGGPVCGCDGQVTYANPCEAYAAGSGVLSQGACGG